MTQYQLQHRLFGMKHGDFMTKHQARDAVIKTVLRMKEQHLPDAMKWIFAPRVGFTNRVAQLHENNNIWAQGFMRTGDLYDGGVAIGPMCGIAIFNGDCPIICLTEDEKLAVLHAGYRCLVRERIDEPNIIDMAMKEFDPAKTHAWIGYGIGPCCWLPEYEDKPEIINPQRSPYPEILFGCLWTTSAKSPTGSGHVSVDLYSLALALLLRAGVPSESVTLDRTCTCCAQKGGQPLYWSHTRYRAGKQRTDGRNMALAWLEIDPPNRPV